MNTKEASTQKKWEQWKKTRAKGTFHFVFFRGVLSWGLPFSVLMWLKDYFFSAQYRESLFEINELLLRIGFLIIGGFLFGIVIWFFSETEYQRSLKNKDFNIWIPKQKANLE